MSSVTQRIKQIKQPRGGYINPKSLIKTEFSDDNKLSEDENIHAILIGLSVDYLTRFMLGVDKNEAFKISLLGAEYLSRFPEHIENLKYSIELLESIRGLDNKSIDSACKLAGYDVCVRGNIIGYKPVEYIEPNEETINNIRIMVNRGLKFIKEYGPIIKDGFTFEGGYTDIVTSGDGDFLTENTLWDMKVSINKPTKDHTLQLLMYYLMGKNSIHKEFDSITQLGLFNPRLNCMYLLDIDSIDNKIIEEVSTEVIGYDITL